MLFNVYFIKFSTKSLDHGVAKAYVHSLDKPDPKTQTNKYNERQVSDYRPKHHVLATGRSTNVNIFQV